MIEMSETDKSLLLGFALGVIVFAIVFVIISYSFKAPTPVCPPCLGVKVTGFL